MQGDSVRNYLKVMPLAQLNGEGEMQVERSSESLSARTGNPEKMQYISGTSDKPEPMIETSVPPIMGPLCGEVVCTYTCFVYVIVANGAVM